MKIVKIKEHDISNGYGIRVSIFVSGCRHNCKGCFNQEIMDFKQGEEFTKENLDKIISLLDKPYISGITFLGGEPLEIVNQSGISLIVKEIRKKFGDSKSIWCYTGFVYEYLINKMLPYCKDLKYILENIDVLVDGKFELDLLDITLQFRGSKNQRVIDMKNTLKLNEIIWALPYEKGESKYIKLPDNKLISDRLNKIILKEIKKTSDI